MKLNYHRLFVPGFLFLILFSGSLIPDSLYAQSVCSGENCKDIASDQIGYNLMIYSVREHLLKDVMEDMSRASALGNAVSYPLGTVVLDRIVSGGFSLTGTATPIRRTDPVAVPGVGAIPGGISAGGAIIPRFFMGFNLGRVMGMKYNAMEHDYVITPLKDKADELITDAINKNQDYIQLKQQTPDRSVPGPYSPLRFDIYINYLKSSYEHKPVFHYNPFRFDFHMQDRGEFRTESKGFLVRYHLIESFRIAGPLFVFQGLALGAGYQESLTNLTYLQGDYDMDLYLLSGNSVHWDGVNWIEYTGYVRSYPAEIHTGIQLLSFINLTIGGGVAINQGWSDIRVFRTGYTYESGDMTDFVNAKLTGDPHASLKKGILTMNLQARAENPPAIAYLKQGTEWNIFFFKIATELYYTSQNTYGGAVSLRMEF